MLKLSLCPFARIHLARVKQPIRAGGKSESVSRSRCGNGPPSLMRELGADAMVDL